LYEDEGAGAWLLEGGGAGLDDDDDDSTGVDDGVGAEDDPSLGLHFCEVDRFLLAMVSWAT